MFFCEKGESANVRHAIVLGGCSLRWRPGRHPRRWEGTGRARPVTRGSTSTTSILSTGQPFATEEACTSSLAENGVVYPLSTAICFDTSWSLIEDQNNGADGSATSGTACASFVVGGGSLAGLRLTTSGTSISFSSLSAFAVNHVNRTEQIVLDRQRSAAVRRERRHLRNGHRPSVYVRRVGLARLHPFGCPRVEKRLQELELHHAWQPLAERGCLLFEWIAPVRA